MPIGSSEQEDDFVMRQIRLLAQTLARICGLQAMGDAMAADAELSAARATLLGGRADLIDHLDPASGAELLAEPNAILAAAELCAMEAELLRMRGAGDRAGALDCRALQFALEAWLRDPQTEETLARIRVSAARLPPGALPSTYDATLRLALDQPTGPA